MLTKRKYSPLNLALILLLVIQFCLIAYNNIIQLDQYLDCDTGKMFYHIAEMARKKTLLLPDWDYVSTLEWDCSSLLALPFYIITNNIILSFGLANVVFLLFFLYIVFFLFRGRESLYPLLCANLLIIPFQFGLLDYYNMLFFGGAQYIIKASIPILLIGLIVFADRVHMEGRKIPLSAIVLSVIYGVLLLVTSVSSSVYVAACGIFPVLAVYIVYKFFRWERISYYFIGLAVCSIAAVLLGGRINMAVMGGTSGNTMMFCSAYSMIKNVSSCFWGMFELFGGITKAADIKIVSFAGLLQLAKFCLVILMLVSAIFSIKNILQKKSELRIILLISVFMWNLFILLVSNASEYAATYEYRYHIIGMLPLMCVTGTFLIDSIQKLEIKQQKFIYLAGYAGILFLCAGSYKNLYSKPEQYADLKELCAYVKNFDVEHVYLFNNSTGTEICRIMDLDTSYICLTDEGTTVAFDYYASYNNAPMQTHDVIVVVNDWEYDFGDSFEIDGHHLTKFDAFENRSLYYFID